jgi:uncharacterized protein (DUF2062 family)
MPERNQSNLRGAGVFNFRRWRRRIYRKVVRLQATPHAIAWGAGLGVIFGCLMPPGFQLITGVPITIALRGNVVTMIVFTFVSSPLSYVPLYFLTCKVGELFLRTLGSSVTLGDNFKQLLADAVRLDLGPMFAAIRPVIWCWITGGLLVGFAGAVPAYYFTRLAVLEIHKLREFSRKRRLERKRALLRAVEEEHPPPEGPDEEAPDEQPPPPADN